MHVVSGRGYDTRSCIQLSMLQAAQERVLWSRLLLSEPHRMNGYPHIK